MLWLILIVFHFVAAAMCGINLMAGTSHPGPTAIGVIFNAGAFAAFSILIWRGMRRRNEDGELL